MKRFALKTILVTLALCTLFASLPLTANADDYKKSFEAVIDGIDCSTDNGGKIFLYPNKTDSVRSIKADEYNFQPVKIMVFDKDGKLIEIGKNLLANNETRTNSPQEYLNIPARGFAIAFTDSANSYLKAVFEMAMEGGMIYNATLSVIIDAFASYDEEAKLLTVKYNRPTTDKNAKKFLFVGNSSTYFNGTPIKFKALARAAGVEVDAVYCTFGSAYLSEFADEAHERGTAFRNKLSTTEYDYIVLQDAGAATYEKSKPACDILVPLIRENGATPLLYMRYTDKIIPEERKDAAKVHYDNYTKLSEDFGIAVAPAAEAFLICTEKYPEINLYADDKSHHSKEGSYLIACTWLYSYLGIDPRGNSYDAQMDESTVTALQECAYSACASGYFNPKELPAESTDEPSDEPSDEPTEESSAIIDDNSQNGGSNAKVYIAIAAIAVIVVVIAVIVILLKKKKQQGVTK